MRELSPTLQSAQQAKSINPLIRIELTHGEDNTYTYSKSRIPDINHSEEPYSHKAELLLNNSDGALTDIDLQGFQGVISYGAITTAGEEYEAAAFLWVIAQKFNSSPGKLDCLLSLVGIPNLMAEDRASANYIPASDDTKKVKDLIREIAGDTGVTHLACFNHTTSYDVVFDSEDGLIDSYQPKDSFRIYINGSRLAALRRLLDYTGCVARFRADGKIHILEPTTSGDTYDYEYSLASGHTFFSKAYKKTLVVPNYIVVQSKPDDDPSYSGSAQDATAYGLMPKRAYHQMRLADDDEADDIAAAILAKHQLQAEMGAADVPMNVGAELFDYVKVTDSRENDNRTGNLGYLCRHYNAAKNEWRMTFSFGNWMAVLRQRALLNELETNTDIGQAINRLQVGDLYAENILADNIDLVWVDPDGTIDLSKIGDNLDNLPDGETYARKRWMHLDAETGLTMQENMKYYIRFSPDSDEETISRGAAPPSEKAEGDYWIDTSGESSIIKRWTGSEWFTIPQSEIDDLNKGILTVHTKRSSLSVDGLVLLDQVYIDSEAGDYALIERTDMSAGHLLLSSVEQTSDYRTVTDANKGTWNTAGTDATQALADAAGARSTADGKIISFFQDTEPAGEVSSEGDLWFDTNDKNKAYRYSGAAWEATRDSDIAQAISDASDAQSTADGKIVTFYQDGEPTGEESSLGDLWVDTNDGNKLYRYGGAAWVEVPPELANAAKTGEWYRETGVALDATYGVSLYGGNVALRTFANVATYNTWKALEDIDDLTGVQCYVGTDGKIYAGAGNVKLDADGITITGQDLMFNYGEGLVGYVYGIENSIAVLGNPHTLIWTGSDGGLSLGAGEIPTLPTADDIRIEAKEDVFIEAGDDLFLAANGDVFIDCGVWPSRIDVEGGDLDIDMANAVDINGVNAVTLESEEAAIRLYGDLGIYIYDFLKTDDIDANAESYDIGSATEFDDVHADDFWGATHCFDKYDDIELVKNLRACDDNPELIATPSLPSFLRRTKEQYMDKVVFKLDRKDNKHRERLVASIAKANGKKQRRLQEQLGEIGKDREDKLKWWETRYDEHAVNEASITKSVFFALGALKQIAFKLDDMDNRLKALEAK